MPYLRSSSRLLEACRVAAGVATLDPKVREELRRVGSPKKKNRRNKPSVDTGSSDLIHLSPEALSSLRDTIRERHVATSAGNEGEQGLYWLQELLTFGPTDPPRTIPNVSRAQALREQRAYDRMVASIMPSQKRQQEPWGKPIGIGLGLVGSVGAAALITYAGATVWFSDQPQKVR